MKFQPWIRKNWINIIFAVFIGLMLFYPPAKVWVLQRVMDTGLFNPGAEKNPTYKARPMQFESAAGDTLNTEQLKGKIIFINYWATWCPPCLAEMPSLQNLYNKYRNDPRYVFVMADADGNLQRSIPFLAKKNMDLPVYRPLGEPDPDLYKGTLPTTIVLDTAGRVLISHSGVGKYDTEKFYKMLDAHAGR